MKTLYLIKFIDHVQLGHLYEHIFLMQLGTWLRQKGLYAYLDFSTEGSTYYSGAVYVTVRLYSPEAARIEDQIRTFIPKLDKPAIENGLLQISAEKVSKVSEQDDDVILSKLSEYQSQPWHDMDSFPVRDTSQIPKNIVGLRLSKVSDRKVLYAHQQIILDSTTAADVRESTLPLFYVLSKVLYANLIEILAIQCGYYSLKDSYNYTSKKISETNTYIVYDKHTLETEVDVTRQFIQTSILNGLTNKIIHFLQNVTLKTPANSPDDGGILDRTGIAIGSKGWQQIATSENIKRVLEGMTIEYKIGKYTDSIHLKDVIKLGITSIEH